MYNVGAHLFRVLEVERTYNLRNKISSRLVLRVYVVFV